MRNKSKRETLEELLECSTVWNYTPAALFAHFTQEFHSGNAAIRRHVEFFDYTEMDFVKIQYEKSFPKLDFIKKPKDWLTMPVYGLDFYEEPLEIVRGLVKEMKRKALIVQTIYSPFMCAADSSSYELLTKHTAEDPESVRTGLERIAESILAFVRECARLGVDGFYASTQGGEKGRFADRSDFGRLVAPLDISLFKEMKEKSSLTILHICDYWLPYDSLDPFIHYPCTAVSLPTRFADDRALTAKEAYARFGKPILGGLSRKGAIQSGPKERIEEEVRRLLADSPDRFIMGADCTVANANWDFLKFAISLAHDAKRNEAEANRARAGKGELHCEQ